jgi:hypothetical protein
MDNEHNTKDIRLTASEIGELWFTYIGDTMKKCVISYFEKIVEDEDIHKVVAFLLKIIKKHIEMADNIFRSVNFPIPNGFDEQDVNLDAKRLYSDVFIINYLKFTAKFSLINQANALSMAAREDVRRFFDDYITSYKELSNRVDNVLLEKGIFMRAPAIDIPDKVEYVESKSYLSGFVEEFFGDERPINALEIAHAFSNIQTNALGKELLMSLVKLQKMPNFNITLNEENI